MEDQENLSKYSRNIEARKITSKIAEEIKSKSGEQVEASWYVCHINLLLTSTCPQI